MKFLISMSNCRSYCETVLERSIAAMHFRDSPTCWPLRRPTNWASLPWYRFCFTGPSWSTRQSPGSEKNEKQTDEHGTTYATRERDHYQVPKIRSPTARQVPHNTCALGCKGTTHRNSHGQLAPDGEQHAKRCSHRILWPP